MIPITDFSVDLYWRLKEKSILLIEDDPWVRDSLSLYLQNRGCRPVSFATAEEGMDAIRKGKFDIILCDYWLPGCDGLAFLRFAKEQQPAAKRILITAYPLSEISAEVEKAGLDDFIQKPFSVETIEYCLARCIDKMD